MDATEFEELVLSRFPNLRKDFEEWEGSLHLQVSKFWRFTQSAIEARSLGVVSECFEIATYALSEGNDELRNAIYVSYLEHLDLRSEAGKYAANLMPPKLEEARCAILDYDEELLGNRRPLKESAFCVCVTANSA